MKRQLSTYPHTVKLTASEKQQLQMVTKNEFWSFESKAMVQDDIYR